ITALYQLEEFYMKKAQTCPRCGSEDLERDGSSFISYMGFDRKYLCSDCGYNGRIALEMDEGEVEEFKKALEEEDIDISKQEQNTPDKSYSWKRMFGGLLTFMLGLGALPLALRSIEGAIGSLLIFVGAGIMYREWKKR
ncbi:MAG: hypothetical protein SVV03_04490, partial [Candidatus Nanohaloarchaea archaeon]|nr:hypothetical protein [Candidatus Nanohaloarchaea archaeon]